MQYGNLAESTRVEDHNGEKQAHIFLQKYYYSKFFGYFYKINDIELQIRGVDVIGFRRDKLCVYRIDEKCSPTYCNRQDVESYMIQVSSLKRNDGGIEGSWYNNENSRTNTFLFTWPSIYTGPIIKGKDGKPYPSPYILEEHIQEMTIIRETPQDIKHMLDFRHIKFEDLFDKANYMRDNNISYRELPQQKEYKLYCNFKKQEQPVVLMIPISDHKRFCTSMCKVTRNDITYIKGGKSDAEF